MEESISVAVTLEHWKEEILNSFTWINDRRISNGPCEGKNNYVKKILSNANGMSNFQRVRNTPLIIGLPFTICFFNSLHTGNISLNKILGA